MTQDKAIDAWSEAFDTVKTAVQLKIFGKHSYELESIYKLPIDYEETLN